MRPLLVQCVCNLMRSAIGTYVLGAAMRNYWLITGEKLLGLLKLIIRHENSHPSNRQ